MSRFLAVLTIAGLAGCASVQPRTEVVVRIEAGPGVATDATGLHVVVRAGPGRPIAADAVRTEHDYPRTGALSFPFELGLVPPAPAADRFFEVTATAERADGTEIVSGRVVSGYARGSTLLLVVRLEDACRGVTCEAAQTCHAAGCLDAFVEPATLRWYVDRPTEVATLVANDGAGGDGVGKSLALSSDGSRALVGTPHGDSAGSNAGSARVFLRTGAAWSEEATLLASDSAGDDSLGWSVALSADGSRALVGAVDDETAAGTYAGSARVFLRTGTTWTEEATLLSSDGSAGDWFGLAVALSADATRALVGVPRSDTFRGENAGSARVFARTGTTWTEESILLAADGAADDGLGGAVALSSDGSRALVGAQHDGVGGADAGSARVFARSGTTWTEEAVLRAFDGAAADELGGAVALSWDGSLALLGAYLDETSAGPSAGSVRAFVRTGTTWTEEATLVPSDGVAYDGFGVSVALSGDGMRTRALVGAPFDGDLDAGSVTMFLRTGTTWTEEATLLASDGAANDQFGYSVAMSSDGTQGLVGAHLDDTARDVDTGSARVFELPR